MGSVVLERFRRNLPPTRSASGAWGFGDIASVRVPWRLDISSRFAWPARLRGRSCSTRQIWGIGAASQSAVTALQAGPVSSSGCAIGATGSFPARSSSKLLRSFRFGSTPRWRGSTLDSSARGTSLMRQAAVKSRAPWWGACLTRTSRSGSSARRSLPRLRSGVAPCRSSWDWHYAEGRGAVRPQNHFGVLAIQGLFGKRVCSKS
jgi:hypothetical protein